MYAAHAHGSTHVQHCLMKLMILFAYLVLQYGYQQGGNQGDGGDWSNVGDVDMAFGMWMDFIDGGSDPILPAAAKAEEEVSGSCTPMHDSILVDCPFPPYKSVAMTVRCMTFTFG